MEMLYWKSSKNMSSQNSLRDILDHIIINRLWSKELVLSRGELLKNEGTIDTNIYFIEEGSMRIFIADEHDEKTIRFGYTGELIVALDSFISETSSPLQIQTIRKTKVKVISKSIFTEIVENNEIFKYSWMQIMSVLLVECMHREIDILTKSPRERYNRVLERSPRLFQEIPHKYIASYLNMSAETLSRISNS